MIKSLGRLTLFCATTFLYVLPYASFLTFKLVWWYLQSRGRAWSSKERVLEADPIAPDGFTREFVEGSDGVKIHVIHNGTVHHSLL